MPVRFAADVQQIPVAGRPPGAGMPVQMGGGMGTNMYGMPRVGRPGVMMPRPVAGRALSEGRKYYQGGQPMNLHDQFAVAAKPFFSHVQGLYDSGRYINEKRYRTNSMGDVLSKSAARDRQQAHRVTMMKKKDSFRGSLWDIWGDEEALEGQLEAEKAALAAATAANAGVNNRTIISRSGARPAVIQAGGTNLGGKFTHFAKSQSEPLDTKPDDSPPAPETKALSPKPLSPKVEESKPTVKVVDGLSGTAEGVITVNVLKSNSAEEMQSNLARATSAPNMNDKSQNSVVIRQQSPPAQPTMVYGTPSSPFGAVNSAPAYYSSPRVISGGGYNSSLYSRVASEGTYLPTTTSSGYPMMSPGRTYSRSASPPMTSISARPLASYRGMGLNPGFSSARVL